MTKIRYQKNEYNDIIYNGKIPDKNIPLVYIFAPHYYENDKDITMYLKFGFNSYKDKDGNIKDVFVVKSCHLDGELHGDKSRIFRSEKDCIDREAEKFKFINDDKYLKEHEINYKRIENELNEYEYPRERDRR